MTLAIVVSSWHTDEEGVELLEAAQRVHERAAFAAFAALARARTCAPALHLSKNLHQALPARGCEARAASLRLYPDRLQAPPHCSLQLATQPRDVDALRLRGSGSRCRSDRQRRLAPAWGWSAASDFNTTENQIRTNLLVSRNEKY